ncbi:MAG: nucleotidyltransferase [Bacteroidia bacterium]|nr:nucleotidyltransferase [Bacteroidia bacterium]
MNIFIEEHRHLLTLLMKAGVDFILVGGYAVIYHGYVRTTGDMDIWLRPDNSVKENFLPVLHKLGFQKAGISQVAKSDFSQAQSFYYGEPPLRVDFLTKVSGLSFSECYSKAVFLQFGKYKIPVLNFNDLIVNKMLSDRLQDKADVDELQKIMKF